MVSKISPEREVAKSIYPAELRTVGNHVNLSISAEGNWINKPKGVNVSEQATHIQMQAFDQNVRYTIDGSEATGAHGFLLAVGIISLIPVPNSGVSVFSVGGSVQYQFVR